VLLEHGNCRGIRGGCTGNNQSEKRKDIKYLRFDEAGDFRGIRDLIKVNAVADMLAEYGIVAYMYTARRVLMRDGRKYVNGNLVINGSGFTWTNEFRAVPELPVKGLKCKGDCSACSLCKVAHGKTIYEKIRT